MPSRYSGDEETPSPEGSTRTSLTARSKTQDFEDAYEDGSSRRKRTRSRRQEVDDDDEDEDVNEDEEEEEEEEDNTPTRTRRRTREPTAVENGEDDDVYDPNQDMDERRELAKSLRAQQRDLLENPEAYLGEDPQKLIDFFQKADDNFKQVKQPNLAAIDSRGLLMAAELSAKRISRQTVGKEGGVDVDEFVSKCITYMTLGRGIQEDNDPGLSSAQHHRRNRGRSNRGAIGVGSDEDEEQDDGDLYNWAHLGRFACVPRVHRPSVPGFLLGPLSVEKKVRRIVKRAAPLKLNKLKEVRPQELRAEDLARTEKTDLTAVCRRIHKSLEDAKKRAEVAAEAELETYDDNITEAQVLLVLDKHALRKEGGIDLMRFVVNPHSFPQTVENMFYVSFLIREGAVQLEFDDFGLPSIKCVDKQNEVEQEGRSRKNRAQRHQAVISIDMEVWRDLIDAFGIKEPMIEHRQEQTQTGPGARSWYS